MNKYIKQFVLAGLIFHVASLACAEETPLENTAAVLETTSITIRMTNNKPYAELRTCIGCMSRLLALTPTAQIYLNNVKINTEMLIDGQIMQGTVFIQKKPIEQISKIVAN